jgi:hypothetical protein
MEDILVARVWRPTHLILTRREEEVNFNDSDPSTSTAEAGAVIPLERTKMATPHIIPFSRQSVEVLPGDEMRATLVEKIDFSSQQVSLFDNQ